MPDGLGRRGPQGGVHDGIVHDPDLRRRDDAEAHEVVRRALGYADAALRLAVEEPGAHAAAPAVKGGVVRHARAEGAVLRGYQAEGKAPQDFAPRRQDVRHVTEGDHGPRPLGPEAGGQLRAGREQGEGLAGAAQLFHSDPR